jgi:hypothetical protein
LGPPREHAKSPSLPLGNPIHKIVYRLKRFIRPCSDTHEQATAFALQIKLELEENRASSTILESSKQKTGVTTNLRHPTA